MEFDFVGKRVMKEWAIIKYENPSEYKKAFGLFKEPLQQLAKAEIKRFHK
jgi:hypothetical protein